MNKQCSLVVNFKTNEMQGEKVLQWQDVVHLEVPQIMFNYVYSLLFMSL